MPDFKTIAFAMRDLGSARTSALYEGQVHYMEVHHLLARFYLLFYWDIFQVICFYSSPNYAHWSNTSTEIKYFPFTM